MKLYYYKLLWIIIVIITSWQNIKTKSKKKKRWEVKQAKSLTFFFKQSLCHFSFFSTFFYIFFQLFVCLLSFSWLLVLFFFVQINEVNVFLWSLFTDWLFNKFFFYHRQKRKCRPLPCLRKEWRKELEH
jgi:hypothetical protein